MKALSPLSPLPYICFMLALSNGIFILSFSSLSFYFFALRRKIEPFRRVESGIVGIPILKLPVLRVVGGAAPLPLATGNRGILF